MDKNHLENSLFCFKDFDKELTYFLLQFFLPSSFSMKHDFIACKLPNDYKRNYYEAHVKINVK